MKKIIQFGLIGVSLLAALVPFAASAYSYTQPDENGNIYGQISFTFTQDDVNAYAQGWDCVQVFVQGDAGMANITYGFIADGNYYITPDQLVGTFTGTLPEGSYNTLYFQRLRLLDPNDTCDNIQGQTEGDGGVILEQNTEGPLFWFWNE